MKRKAMEKAFCFGLATVMTLGLAGCGGQGSNNTTQISAIKGCLFEAPKEIYEKSIDYEDMMINSLTVNGSEIEDYIGTKMEFNNVFSVNTFDDSFSISVYDLPEELDLDSINKDNAHDELLQALELMRVPIPGTNESWGIDVTSAFYQNIKVDEKLTVMDEEDGSQRMIIPYTSDVLLDGTNGQSTEFTVMQSDEMTLYKYRGCFSLISKDGETKMMVLHCFKDDKIDLEHYAKSLQFADNPGATVQFDSAELERMNKNLEDIIQQNLMDSGLEIEDRPSGSVDDEP